MTTMRYRVGLYIHRVRTWTPRTTKKRTFEPPTFPRTWTHPRTVDVGAQHPRATPTPAVCTDPTYLAGDPSTRRPLASLAARRRTLAEGFRPPFASPWPWRARKCPVWAFPSSYCNLKGPICQKQKLNTQPREKSCSTLTRRGAEALRPSRRRRDAAPVIKGIETHRSRASDGTVRFQASTSRLGAKGRIERLPSVRPGVK